jgi:hypothetical protein
VGEVRALPRRVGVGTTAEDEMMRPTYAQGRAHRCRQKFLKLFPDGFRDPTYLAWEREYKWNAHRDWREHIGAAGAFRARLDAEQHSRLARAAVKIEAGRPLLFSFEKMALRDAVGSEPAARTFTEGLYDWLHGVGSERVRFERWAEVMAGLPRRGTRVATWPTTTVFGFLARPRTHVFLKPKAMQQAARQYGKELDYSPRIAWRTYTSMLRFCAEVGEDLTDLRPRDQIDIQSFLWIIGSDEYA